MKWIVGTIAIVLALVIIVIAVSLLGDVGLFLILLAGAFYLLAPMVGEAIIDWFEKRKWSRDHPWPAHPPNLNESDLDIMRMHTHDQAVMEDLGILPEGPNGES